MFRLGEYFFCDGPGPIFTLSAYKKRDSLANGFSVRRARHLTEDGTALADTILDIWRLPSREEIVRSMTRGGRNAGGIWDVLRHRPTHDSRPDKESPLWDQYAPLIYLWTAEEESEQRAWIAVYHGGAYLQHLSNFHSSIRPTQVRQDLNEG